MGRRYKIESKLEVIFDNGEIIENIITKVDGCLRKYDPHYVEIYGGCFADDVPCEEIES
ncbi:hypothetical protein MNBD_IGNAVI01-2833 [hydrothermal vent metagenome]|uniref:Uncharacterized protein n=1 Tax=hydrothermal vent metagenome TaxID=652676 RepID=A0A3B1BI02_9ZZZZ